MALNLPRKSSRLGREFFARSAETVAKDLLGRILVVEGSEKYARLREIAAYQGEEEPLYEVLLYAPGILGISNRFGQNLLHIATDKICKPSCLTVIAADVTDKKGISKFIHGSGNVTRELEIGQNYDAVPLNSGDIWIGGKAVNPNEVMKRNRSNLPDNCVGYFYFR